MARVWSRLPRELPRSRAAMLPSAATCSFCARPSLPIALASRSTSLGKLSSNRVPSTSQKTIRVMHATSKLVCDRPNGLFSSERKSCASHNHGLCWHAQLGIDATDDLLDRSMHIGGVVIEPGKEQATLDDAYHEGRI